MREYENCTLCPRMCGVDRTQSVGYCGMGDKAVIARAALHFWEEPFISGKNGSGAVFFSGCNLRCVYCQNYKISHERFGREVSTQELAEIFLRLKDAGAENINLVNPTHFTPTIIEALASVRDRLGIPVVWNSGGYERAETIKKLDGLVDIYLPDLKYISGIVSKKYSSAEDYFQRAVEAVGEMIAQTGEPVFEGGMMKRGTVIRHLVLPGMTVQSMKILAEIKKRFSENTYVSLMGQYFPAGKVDENNFSEINRTLRHSEYSKVVRSLRSLGFENGCIQSLEAADDSFVPDFSGKDII